MNKKGLYIEKHKAEKDIPELSSPDVIKMKNIFNMKSDNMIDQE